MAKLVIFQSTLSMRRATRSKGFFRSFIDISIHALHEESDLQLLDWRVLVLNFNPRSP